MSNSSGVETLSRDMQELLHGFAQMSGLSPFDAELVKFTNNAVFRFPADGVVLRIAGSPTARDRASKVVAVARWLEDVNFPAVRLVRDAIQPLHLGEHVATLWQDVPSVKYQPNGADLGQLLKELHSLAPPNFSLPQWQPVAGIRSRLSTADSLVSVEDIEFLHKKCDEMEVAISEISYLLPIGPIHGDSFIGNLIPGDSGVVLCDFDSTSIGPREWDLIPTAVGHVRFDYEKDIQGPLARSYGLDVMKWDGFDAFRNLRELQLVTSVIPTLSHNPNIVAQWRWRLQSFKRGARDVHWSPYR
ncbi:aminoglycoside phosphotransferase family protein [Micromonospora sp. NPDC092111]|uniref:aminoglycoside phosphotransferase family protein n=1 Tax=Micromonospora sp. NPDC092111 TaxID=3364289 RepID=UPI0037F1C614